MPESYWEKRLSDNTLERGTDQMIQDKLASWTKGRQDIMSARLCYAGTAVTIFRFGKDGEFADWKQLDNFVFNPGTGETTRLSRELWCSTEGRPFLHAVRIVDGPASFSLEEKAYRGCIAVPESASYLVCSIARDGKVKYRWS